VTGVGSGEGENAPRSVAIDVGSTSVKLYAGAVADGEIAFEELARFDNETTWEDGRHVWDVPALVDHLREGVGRAVERYDEVKSVGVDATAMDFGLLADGELLRNPYFYRDPSLWTTVAETSDLCPEREAFHLTGYNGSAGPMHYQVRESPDLFERADAVVPLPQLLSAELGGRPSAETSYAHTLRIFDVRSHTWADELVDAIGFPRGILPDADSAGTVVGTVDAARVSGVEPADAPDIVLPPSHDTASAVGALPLTRDDNAFLATGSWFIPGIEVAEPIVTDAAFDAGGSNEVGVAGTTRFIRNLPGFSLLEHCRDDWREAGGTHAYDALFERVAEMGPDGPLVDVRDERFVQAQFDGDVPATVRAYCEETGQSVPDDEFAVTRTLLASLAVGTALTLETLLDVAGESVDRVHLGGGGVRNDLFCQWFASALDRSVHAGPTEATALGNLLVQFRSRGAIADIAEGRDLVAETFDVTEYRPENQGTWTDLRAKIDGLDA
jgi:rhamnulokinase